MRKMAGMYGFVEYKVVVEGKETGERGKMYFSEGEFLEMRRVSPEGVKAKYLTAALPEDNAMKVWMRKKKKK